MEYILQTSALGKNYRKFKALENFNISVPKGAIYGLVGKNGAGKTTLLRLICGLQTPSYGTYSLYGVNNESPDITRSRRRMGDVSDTQTAALVLDEMGLEYKILENKQVDIYDAVNVSKLVTALTDRGCEVYTVQNHDESLESYFLSLVGTGKGRERHA